VHEGLHILAAFVDVELVACLKSEVQGLLISLEIVIDFTSDRCCEGTVGEGGVVGECLTISIVG
jgi:hypothetical protein